MPFSHLIGNEPAKAALLRMHAQDCVPSTLLFVGPEGVGKASFAHAFASLLLGPSDKLLHGNHPDLHLYHPEGKSGMHTIDAMRQVRSEVLLPPFEAPVKVFILYDADRMLPASSNALLKTLEEPEERTHFVLLSSSRDALLPTIVSRCRAIPFFPIPQKELCLFLQNKWSTQEAERLSLLAHGSLSRAQRLAEGSQDPLLEQLPTLLFHASLGDRLECLRLIAKMDALNQTDEDSEGSAVAKRLELLLEAILGWYRDLHLLRAGGTPTSLYHSNSLSLLQQVPGEPPPLEPLFARIEQAQLALQRHMRLKAVLEHLIL